MNIQTLHDALAAVLVTLGVTGAVTVAFAAAGAYYERGKARAAQAVRVVSAPAQHPTQTDDTRQFVLR
jgi:hypothetical protein